MALAFASDAQICFENAFWLPFPVALTYRHLEGEGFLCKSEIFEEGGSITEQILCGICACFLRLFYAA